jgi:hypothetical protein
MIRVHALLRRLAEGATAVLLLTSLVLVAEWRRSRHVEDTLVWRSWAGENRSSDERRVGLIFAAGRVTFFTRSWWWRDWPEEQWMIWGPRGEPGLHFHRYSEPLAHARRILGESAWNRRGFGMSSITEQRRLQSGVATGSTERYVTAPAWALTGGLLSGPALFVGLSLGRRWLPVLRRRRRRRAGRCERCGYDVSATPRRCPECGWAVKPPKVPDRRAMRERPIAPR